MAANNAPTRTEGTRLGTQHCRRRPPLPYPKRWNPPRPVTGALIAKGVLERSGGATFAQGEPAGASDRVGRRAPGRRMRSEKEHPTPTPLQGWSSGTSVASKHAAESCLRWLIWETGGPPTVALVSHPVIVFHRWRLRSNTRSIHLEVIDTFDCHSSLTHNGKRWAINKDFTRRP